CQVFDETHDKAILAVGLDDQCWDLVLAQCLVGLQAALAADELVARAVRIVPLGYGDWLLQSEISDVSDDLPKHLPVANSGVYDCDPVDGDEGDGGDLSGFHQAASRRRTRDAMANSGSRLSKR